MWRALTGTEDVAAAIAAGSKVVVMAVGTVEFLVLGGKGLIDEGSLAVTALKASLMPVLVLVRQVLRHVMGSRKRGESRIHVST